MRTNSETVVGVVGAGGQLGSKVADMAAEHGFTVLGTDTKKLLGGTSLDMVMTESDFVHFCIPENGFEGLYELRDGQSGVLHDSVMDTSLRINKQRFSGKADTAHMFMNEKINPSGQGSVAIELSSPNFERVKAHMLSLGLKVVEMRAPDHDRLSARGQGLQALGVVSRLPELKKGHEDEVLTPSAYVALQGLLDSSTKLTPQTLDSIFKNPELPKVLREMLEFLADRGNS